MSSNSFLSVSNIKYLINIMENVFVDKHNIRLSDTTINLKNIFFTIMRKIQDDPENQTLDMIQKNKLTLKIVKEIVKTELSTNIKVSHNMDTSLYPDRKQVYQNRQTNPSNLSGNSDVSAKMERIENTRKQENVKEVKSLGDINKVVMDQSFDEKEFEQKMKELTLNRDQFNDNLKQLYPEKKSFTTTQEHNHMKNDNTTDFIESRNRDMSVITNKPLDDIDPTLFFKENNKINTQNNMDQNLVPKTYQNLGELPLIKKENYHDSRLVKRFILINSYDRNWLHDKYRYEYKVKFSYNTNEILKIPYYDNNPTVPHTKTEKSDGIKNDFGWVDKNGTFYDAYDPSKPLTTNLDSEGKMIELGFEEVEVVVDQDASMIGTFKDIYSIKITNITIPADINSDYVYPRDNTTHNFNFNFPYILCNIDQFQDVYDGTDDTIRKSFCQLQYENYFQTPNGRGYLIMKPVQDEIKIFYPNPLSSLPTLNLSLTKPNGELLNTGEDGQSIFNISIYQLYYLKITTTTFFEKNAFCKGDFVRIKNFNLYQINSDISMENINKFNLFINRTELHTVHNSGEPNENGYYNNFYIKGPGYFDKMEGRFVIDQVLMDTLAKFNQHLVDNDFYQQSVVSGNTYENGYLLNMSLQNSISMTIEMYKPDSKIMIHEKI